MKTIKLYLLSIIILINSLTLLVSCQKNVDPFSVETITTNAEIFLSSLYTEDYQTAIDLSYLPNSSFITATDIEVYIENSSYKQLIENRDLINNIEISEDIKDDGYNKTVHASIYDKDNNKIIEYDLTFILNEENQWRIDISEFYITDWKLKTCGGNSVIYIDGQEAKNISYASISDSYGGGQETYRVYTFGAIGKTTKLFSIKADTFAEASMSLTPGVDNDALLRADISSEDSIVLFEDIKNSWNGLYGLFSLGSDYSDAYNYLSSNLGNDVIDKIWQNFRVLSAKGTDFEITSVYTQEGSTCFYYTDTLVVANFTYDITWSGGSMTESSSLIMRYEDGKYKICIIPFEKLFYYASEE